MTQLGGARQQDGQRGRHASDPAIEERPREGIDRQNQPDRGENGDDLRGQSPGVGPVCRRNTATSGLGRRDQGGIEGVRIGPADDVGPGLRCETAARSG